MSGVIDENGQQWEHCYNCGRFVRIQDLVYTECDADHPFGSQLCDECYRLGCPEYAFLVTSRKGDLLLKADQILSAVNYGPSLAYSDWYLEFKLGSGYYYIKEKIDKAYVSRLRGWKMAQ